LALAGAMRLGIDITMSIEAKALTLAEILDDTKGINVPRYQRNYKWERKMIEDIFEDVVMFANDDDRAGFMGSIVFCPRPDGLDDVVDGQQRLTTITVLAAILARMIAEAERGSPLAARTFSLLQGDDGKSSKIRHKDYDRAIYEPLVAPGLTGYMRVLWAGDASPSEHAMAMALVGDSKLYGAFTTLRELVEAAAVEAFKRHKTPADAFYRHLLEAIMHKVVIVRIRADNHAEGIRIFEALNTSGMPLTVDELLKSAYMMHASRFSQAAEADAQAIWEGPNDSVCAYLPGEADRQKFLRAHWLAHRGQVTKGRLYDVYSDLLATLAKDGGAKALQGFGAEMAKSAKLYAEISSCGDNWNCLDTLNSFGFEMHKVPLMALAVSKHYQDVQLKERIRRLAFALEVVLVRMSICGQSTSMIDKSFATLAEKIGDGELDAQPDSFSQALRQFFLNAPNSGSPHIVASDSAFESHLCSAEISAKGRKWKLFVARIANEMQFPGTAQFKHIPVIGNTTLGLHIDYDGPEPSRSLLAAHGYATVKEYKDAVASLGNLFVVDKASGEAARIKFNGLVTSKVPSKMEIDAATLKFSSIAAKIWSL